MSIHYKFNTALQFDTVTFDGLHITLKELKKQIAQQKKIGKDYDLQVTNAQTKEVFKDDNELIAKNSSLVVARIPVATQARKQWDRDGHHATAKNDDAAENALTKSIDISSLNLTEEDKIKTMMSQSTSDYDPANYVKMRGYNQTGPVPPNYICFKCHQRGHWIKDCKSNVEGQVGDVKKSTGIPRSFMVPVDGPQVPGARLTPSGEFVAPSIDLQVYKEKKIEKPPFLAEKEAAAEETRIPEDLQCSICKDLMQDAVMAPCCGNSFCDECIRNVLVESDEAECPECNEKEVSPDTLIPNRFVRNNVNNFKNKTGYSKRAVVGKKTVSPPRPSLPDFIPPTATKHLTTEKPVEAASALVNNGAEEEAPKSDVNSDGANNDAFLYDIAVEKERDKRKHFRRGRSSQLNKDGDSSDSSSDSSQDSYDPSEDTETKGSAIPSLTVKPNVGMHGQERSGTPTVDERYDVYGAPPGVGPLQLPLMPPGVNMPMPMGPFPPMGMPIPPPMYNPNFPPPMVGPRPGLMPPFMDGGRGPMGMPFPPRGPGGGGGGGDFHGRDGDRDNRDRGRQFRARYPPRIPPLLPAQDNDEAFRAFERMLQEKEERDKMKNRVSRSDHSRSRSPRSRQRSRSRSKSGSYVSNSRRRSYTPIKRSRSRSKSVRRSRSPSARARSHSRSRYSKSPVATRASPPAKASKSSPRRYGSPHRSPSQRYDRAKDYSEGNNGWDRRGRRVGNYGRSRHSPQRQYGSYSRYGSPSRGHSPEPHSYDGGYSSRWNEKDRYRRRSRSRSYSRERERGRTYQDDRRGEGDRRSASRGRGRSPDTDRDRHRHREDRNGHSKHRDDDYDNRRHNASVDRRHSPRRNRTRSPVLKVRDKKASPSPAKHQRKHSSSPTGDARNPSPVRSSRSRERDQVRAESHAMVSREGAQTPPSAPVVTATYRSPVADSPHPLKMEQSPERIHDDRLARNPSPSVTEKSLSKKEKKKDKEKKKRKKEKETDEEREARRKRKREKKEKKKSAEVVKGENSPPPLTAPSTPHATSNAKEHVLEKVAEVQAPRGLSEQGADAPETPAVAVAVAVAVAQPASMADQAAPAQHTHLITASPINDNKDGGNSRRESDDEEALDLNTSYENLVDPEPEVLAPLPELSRWEVDEAEMRAAPTTTATATVALKSSSESGSVTTEVIKRAENAIFKKAISALQTSKKKTSGIEKMHAQQSEKDQDRLPETLDIDKKISAETAKKGFKMHDDSVKKISIAVEYNAPNSKSKERRLVIKEHSEKPVKRTISAQVPGENPTKITCSETATERVYKEVKGKPDRRKPGNSIQITIPIIENTTPIKTPVENEEIKTPPGRVPAKDRLGLKVDKAETSASKHGIGKCSFPKTEQKRSLHARLERESSAEDLSKSKRLRKKSQEPESKKRHRSSTESSDESTKKKRKRTKHKKEKGSKKKVRKDESDSSYSSDFEVERKKNKKSKKKKKKSRHS